MKKMLPRQRQRTGAQIKVQILTTKISDLLPGHVESRMVKCGKKSCKCARGQLHGPYFYHITTANTERTRRYIPLSIVPDILAACEQHRRLQARIRTGRADYKRTISAARELLRGLKG